MRSIASWSARFRVLVLGLAVATMVVGAVMLPDASLDALPEFGPPTVEVQTEALGLSAEEVEQLITVPLESSLLNGVAFLGSIESESVQGLSSILMTFEDGTDPIRARQMVAERLTLAHELPNVSRPPVMLQPLSSSNRLMMVSLSSESLSLIDLSVLARWTIEPRLMGVPGVANVAIWGQRERQLQVLVDPVRLRENNVTLDEIVATTGNALWVSPLTYLEASTPGTGGFIDTPNQRLNVQHIFPIDTAEDLGRVPIETTNPEARGLRLADVADVVEDHQPLIGDAIVHEEPGLILVIEKFPEANTTAVTAAVEDALAAMAPGLAGVQIDSTIFRPATFIESAIANVGLAVLLGLVFLAVVVAGLFLDWRAAIVSLVSIPLSLTAGALVLHLAGSPINIMVVAGMVAALAVVVDDAVIGTHEIMRRIRAQNGAATGQRVDAVVQAVTSVRGPMVFATLAGMLVAGPLFLVGEVTGALLPSALVAYLLAVAASMVVSLTVAPALAALLAGRSGLERTEPRFLAWLQRKYAHALSGIFDRQRVVFSLVGAAAGVVVLFAVGMAPTLADAGLPELQERDLLIEFDGAPGTSHTEMSRIVAGASGELRGVDGVRGVGAHVGRAVVSDQIVEINAGQIWMSIAPDADYAATRRSIEAVVAGYPGLERTVSTHGQERIERILDPETDDITVRLFGNSLEPLRASATEVRDAIAAVDGVSSASVEPQIDEPTIDIEVNLAAAAEHGLRPGDVRRAAATLISGIEVGSLFEEQKVFEVVVWGVPEHRRSVTGVEELLIETPSGKLVALGDIADVSIASSPTVIRRDAVQDAIDVGVSVAGRDVGAVLADVEDAIAAVDFPLESHAEVLEHTAIRQARQGALLATAAGVLVGIFLLLQAAFISWRLAALVFLALPATLAGGVVVAVAIGGVGSIGSAIGLLAVLALTLRNGIGQVDRYRRMEQTAGERFGPGLVLRGAREQLPPQLVTALGTAAALLPFAVLGGRAGLEVVQPMAMVILGGLVSSTLINLFVVPSLFLRSGSHPQSEMVAVSIEQARDRQAIGAG
jgi:Cu/Ag efflux pump CusA